MSGEDPLFQRFGKDLPKGSILFREGDPGREMFVLQSGKVAISKRVRDVEKLLAVLGPGEFFGEMAIISNRPRNATAVVEEPAKLLVIDPKTFEGMIRSNSEIAVRLIKKLAERLSEADDQIERLLLADPGSRIVQEILRTCERSGRLVERGTEIEFVVRDLPQKLGVGEPAIRMALTRLSAMGFLEWGGDKVTALDAAGLQAYLQYLELRWKFGEW